VCPRAPAQNDLLAVMGQTAGGTWLRLLVSIDAVVVLSGAVLTAYVGVTGLLRRLAMDRCMPAFLMRVRVRPCACGTFPAVVCSSSWLSCVVAPGCHV
jgi:amino acid transporter